MSETQDLSPVGRRISRRTVAKGVAWSVPVMMIATAAPALGDTPPLSQSCEPTFSFSTDSCKYSGQSGSYNFAYKLRICSTLANGCNTASGSAFYIWGVQSNNNTTFKAYNPISSTPQQPVELPWSIQVPANGCSDVILLLPWTYKGNAGSPNWLSVYYTTNPNPSPTPDPYANGGTGNGGVWSSGIPTTTINSNACTI